MRSDTAADPCVTLGDCDLCRHGESDACAQLRTARFQMFRLAILLDYVDSRMADGATEFNYAVGWSGVAAAADPRFARMVELKAELSTWRAALADGVDSRMDELDAFGTPLRHMARLGAALAERESAAPKCAIQIFDD